MWILYGRIMRRWMLTVVVVASAMAMAIVAVAVPGPVARSANPPKAAGATASPYIDEVAGYLRKTSPASEGKLWWVTHSNVLPATFIQQTPNCWDTDACGSPPPAGERLLTRITQMVARARTIVDLTDLWPPPDGRFLQAVIQGLCIAHLDHPAATVPLVRIMAGKYPADFVGSPKHIPWLITRAYLHDIRFACNKQTYPLRVQIAYVQPKIYSWVHEKAIDVDGQDVLIGGMNYWSSDYLDTSHPVNDLSIEVAGPAARDVLSFDNILWRWACQHSNRSQLTVSSSRSVTFGHGGPCIWAAAIGPTLDTSAWVTATRSATVLTVGHLGVGIDVPGVSGKQSPPISRISPSGARYPSGNRCKPYQRDYSDVNDSRTYEYENPGEDAIRALIGTAKRSIFLSQQDVLSCAPGRVSNPWEEPLFDSRIFQALAIKILKGVPITIVLSAGKGHDYTNGFSPADVANALTSMVSVRARVDARVAKLKVCADVQLAKLQQGPQPTWADGSPYRNHAKVVAVDDQAFYVGSENVYPSRLQELGMIVEDPTAAFYLRVGYLDPVWEWSSKTAIIDPRVRPAVCNF